MATLNIGFINANGKNDETQLDLEQHNVENGELIELINLLLSLKEEMGIKEVTYVDEMECEEKW